jgi:hypothetical protein
MLRIACISSHKPGGRLGQPLGVIGLPWGYRHGYYRLGGGSTLPVLARPGIAQLSRCERAGLRTTNGQQRFPLAVIIPAEVSPVREWARFPCQPMWSS